MRRDGARCSDFVVDIVHLCSNRTANKHQKSLLRPRNATLSQFWTSRLSPLFPHKGMFYSPAPSLVAVVRSFYKHMPKRAFSNLHSIAALRIASHATSQCVCLRVHACEYTCVPSLNDCELQFGVGVVQCEFMLQNRARNPKLRPSADGHRSDSLTYEPE